MHVYKTKQVLKTDINTAWEFLSNPKNLKSITPQFMGFDIISCDDKKMYQGQIIEYIVKPFLNIPFKWVTEISHIKHQEYFVDEQRFGPYTFWHHKHFLNEIDGGVEMVDVIHYKIPFGYLGRFIHYLLIKSKIISIFEYRKERLEKIYNN